MNVALLGRSLIPWQYLLPEDLLAVPLGKGFLINTPFSGDLGFIKELSCLGFKVPQLFIPSREPCLVSEGL
jgi:hypothetical protein